MLCLYSCGQKCQPALFKPKIKRVCANFGMVATVHSICELGVIACSSEEREKFRRENENVYWTMIYHSIPLFA